MSLKHLVRVALTPTAIAVDLVFVTPVLGGCGCGYRPLTTAPRVPCPR